MKNESFWGFDNSSMDELVATDRIVEVMNDQCKYLYDYTQGKVFAIFDVIKREGTLLSVIKTMSEVSKYVSKNATIQDTVGEVPINELIDASDIYCEKEYAFEIYTDTYRYRLFSLKMASIYPVKMKIEEVVYEHIMNELSLRGIKSDKDKYIVIENEESFCDALKLVLQDKKVRYIINELQKSVLSEKESDRNVLDKIIVCEGRNDEIIIDAIAQKLNCKPIFVVADGKNNISNLVSNVHERNANAQILVVIDSDGEEEKTKALFEKKVGKDGYQLLIVNNRVEDWFIPDVEDFSKLKLLQTIDTIVGEVEFDELRKKYDSFDKLLKFLER